MKLAHVAVLLPALLVATGCDDDEDEFFDIGEDQVAFAGCGDVLGTFFAEEIRVVTVDGMVTDLTGADFAIEFGEDAFRSRFSDPFLGAATASGPLAFDDDTIVIGNDPLFPRLEDDVQRFECDLDDDRLTLTSRSIRFDFDDDGTFEGARLFITFERD